MNLSEATEMGMKDLDNKGELRGFAEVMVSNPRTPERIPDLTPKG